MGRLAGKVALVTGASAGIGRATARHGSRGCEGRGGRRADGADRDQAGGDSIAVSQEDSVRAAVETAVRHYGGLHILHNNAGGSTRLTTRWSRRRSRSSDA